MGSRPDLARDQARAVLDIAPDEPRARLVAAMADRRLGDNAAAADGLRRLAREQPAAARVHQELALALRDLGDEAGARRATADHLRASAGDPELLAAADALCADRLAEVETLLRARLKRRPDDPAALRLLAEAGTRLGRWADAEAMLTRCLELAPDFEGARYNLAIVLHRQQKGAEALGQVDHLLRAQPREPAFRLLRAACLSFIGDYEQAVALYRDLLAGAPGQTPLWMSLGHSLRTLGRRDEAIEAYERAIALSPHLGEAWWSLANLKTLAFTPAQEQTMGEQLRRPDLSEDDRLHLHYAQGKALEDAQRPAEAFESYSRGAAIRRAQAPYDADAAHVRAVKAASLFDSAFFAQRTGWGCPQPDPLFIVGLPRSGSTLIEQILASHSQVEGVIEFPDIPRMVRDLGRTGDALDRIAELTAEEARALGEQYLASTRIHRKTDKPLFIDKMPNNFMHLALIRLILPKAKVIDARRHPMAAGFSAFKQHFARGQAFSYDLRDIGRYYGDYVLAVRAVERAAPGWVHRVIHEDLVAAPEAEIRRLLDHLNLPFEPGCLEFHRNARPVRTASSEQVRRPISRDGLDQWRRFEPWLAPLAEALGPELAGGGWRA